ncbi:MAG: hypothetical protein IJI36_01545 [Kiritimatiellae bacterium]|nr:hypothetical protein [Kiritimatiellia bacterium]
MHRVCCTAVLFCVADGSAAMSGECWISWLWFGVGVAAGLIVGAVCGWFLKSPPPPPVPSPPLQPNAVAEKPLLAFPTVAKNETVEQWLTSHVLLDVFNNQYDKMNSFLEGMISCSQGTYCAAAQVGESFNRKRMRAREMLLAGAKVREVVYCGLMDVKTGEVVLKAYVK